MNKGDLGLALGGITFVVATLACLRLWLGLDTGSLKRRVVRRAKKPKLTGEPAYADVRVEADD